MEGRRQPVIDRSTLLAALLLLAAFLAAAFLHAASTSATYDEPPHLASGYWQNRFSDFRLNPEHPPLLKRLATLPWSLSDRWPAALELGHDPPATAEGRLTWQEIERLHRLAPAETDAQWPLAHSLIYGVRDATLERFGVSQTYAVDPARTLTPADYLNPVDGLLLEARSVNVLLGALLVGLIGLWAFRLHGAAGGLLALAMASFDPNLIAHSSLVTTDVALALFLFAAVFFSWRALGEGQDIVLWPLALALLAAGLAFASKYSAVVLPPIAVLLALAVLAYRRAWRWRFGSRHGELRTVTGRILAVCGVGLLAGLAVAVTIWTSYDGRFAVEDDGTRLPLEQTLRRARVLEQLDVEGPVAASPERVEELASRVELDAGARALLWLEEHRLLPQAYLAGLAEAWRKGQSRTSFLRGEISTRGFESYFFWTVVLKTPLLDLALILAGTVLAVRRLRRLDLVFLVIPPLVYFAFALAGNLNIGHRHLLPIYPFLYVLGGTVLAAVKVRWRLPLIAAVILGSSVVLTARPQVVAPHYLAYFNELAGGPRGGSRPLVDSNLDWGQDLPRLAQWLRERSIDEPIYLCYFGTADPRHHGIRFVNLPGCYAFAPPFGSRSFAALREPGLLAISATHASGAYFDPELRRVWRQVLDRATLVDTAGHSILIYRWEG